MPLRRFRLILAGSFWLFGSAAYGQIPTESTLADNTAKLTVTVKMDRDVYFPGELYEATFEVANLTGSPLLAITPFQGAECVSLSAREGDKLINMAAQDGGCRQRWNVPPVTTFGPGEGRKEVLHSYGESFWPQLTGYGGAPDLAGTFVLRYSYGPGAEVEFTVAPAKVEAKTMARVNDVMYTDRPAFEDPRPIPTYVDVFSLRWQDQSYICVSQAGRDPHHDPTRKADEIDAVLPYKRVATSQDSVVSLTATADPGENLTIEWKTSSGGQGSVDYPASYVARDVSERLRKRIQEQLDRDK
jgi:hypothetical protein